MLKRAEIEPAEAGGAGTSEERGREPRLPVLLILHQHHSSPGHVGRWLQMHGFPLDIRRCCLGDTLPETLEHHTGVVIFGGPMSATDCDDYIRREIDWIGVPLKEKKPYLGICLGAQQLAIHLGAHVGFDPEGYAEIGYHPIRPTAEGEALFDWPERVYQWHREGFAVPEGATLLAEGDRFSNQAFRYGRSAYALQFHPEISHHLVHRWTTRGGHRLVLPGAKAPGEHVRGHIAHGPGQRRWLGQFLAHWTGLGRVDPAWR